MVLSDSVSCMGGFCIALELSVFLIHKYVVKEENIYYFSSTLDRKEQIIIDFSLFLFED